MLGATGESLATLTASDLMAPPYRLPRRYALSVAAAMKGVKRAESDAVDMLNPSRFLTYTGLESEPLVPEDASIQRILLDATRPAAVMELLSSEQQQPLPQPQPQPPKKLPTTTTITITITEPAPPQKPAEASQTAVGEQIPTETANDGNNSNSPAPEEASGDALEEAPAEDRDSEYKNDDEYDNDKSNESGKDSAPKQTTPQSSFIRTQPQGKLESQYVVRLSSQRAKLQEYQPIFTGQMPPPKPKSPEPAPLSASSPPPPALSSSAHDLTSSGDRLRFGSFGRHLGFSSGGGSNSNSNSSSNSSSSNSSSNSSRSSSPPPPLPSSSSSFSSSTTSSSFAAAAPGDAVVSPQNTRKKGAGGAGAGPREFKAPAPTERRGDPEALLEGIRAMLDDPTMNVDYWSSRPLPHGEWVTASDSSGGDDATAASATTDSEAKDALSLVDVGCRSAGYSVEVGAHSVVPGPLVGEATLDGEEEAAFFGDFVKDTPHENYAAPEIPAVITVQSKASRLPFCKVIIRTKRADKRVILPFERGLLKAVRAQIPGYKGQKLTFVKKPGFDDDLATYEQKEKPARTFKFGVLYVKAGQTDENAIFANTEEDASEDYRHFLRFLGEEIALRGWSKYRAGLDVTSDNTGVHSVFTEHENGRYQIMYHVATMLPNQAIDEQKVERKRHIGNDVVVIIFKEQSGPDDRFDPRILTSHFNHCFFVFSVAKRDDKGAPTHYRLTVANKPAVAPYQPYLPEDPVFERNEAFHKFLLTKRKQKAYIHTYTSLGHCLYCI